MRNTIKNILVIIGLIIGIITVAQDRPIESISLINNINSPSDLYNGAVNFNLPLFEIPVGGVKIRSELSYISKPFQPDIDESLYGLNWDLNQFGQITREVNQDILLKESLSEAVGQGLGATVTYEALSRKTTDCINQRQDLLNGYSKKQVLLYPNVSNVKYEFNPNKYYFDFFGYKGYFVFDNNGKALVNCDTAKLKVVTSNISSCYSSINNIDFQNKNISEIKMADDMGNIFYFGGEYNAVDVSYAEYSYALVLPGNGRNAASRGNYIVSWHLKKVELSNGDVIVASYKNGNSSIYNNFLQTYLTSDAFPTSLPTKSQRDQANIYVSESDILIYNNFSVASSARNKIQTKKSILEKIEVLGKEIEVNFNYLKDSNGSLHLSNINTQYSGKSENINFKQVALGGSNYRYFLESLKKNDESYHFEYYKTDNLPNKNASNITNSFGYWNMLDQNDNYDVTLLRKIRYPTGGSELFEYEKSNASKRSNTATSSDISDLDYVSIPRLFKKTVDDGTKQYVTTFTYKLGNGKSSGITIFTPLSDVFIFITNKRSSTDPFYYSYSQVQEKNTKGTIEYFFTDYITNPNLKNTKYIDGNNTPGLSTLIPTDPPVRGKLLKRKIYDLGGNLVRQHDYEYTSFLKPESELMDQLNNDCTACKISDESYYVYHKTISRTINTFIPEKSYTSYIPVIPYLLKKEVVTDYLNGVQMSSSTEFGYRESSMFWHPYPTKITTNNSGKLNVSNIFYPGDVLSTGSCYTSNCTFINAANPGRKMLTYKQMVDDNIHFPILTINKNDLGKYSLSENIYEKAGTNKYRLTSQSSSELNSLFTESNFENASVFEDVKYEIYDSKNNLLQSRSKTGVPVTTLWGYHQMRPIVKIEGATYAQVMQAFNLDPNNPESYLQLSIVEKSDLDINDIKESELIAELNTFRTNVGLKDYFVNTYSHDPLIGLKSTTPSSGIRESYKYDSSNRLSLILNGSDNIIKEYKYNYAPITYFNIAKSKSFVKNDCGYDAYGSTYNYMVPASKYMSIIDQADADQLAQNEIDMHGQNTANMNGTCGSPAFCSFNPENDINGVTSTIERLSDIKVRVQINIPISLNGLNSSNSNLPLQGFFIGEIADGCQLISSSNQLMAIENGRKWIVTMGINGSIYIKLFEGAISPSSTSAGSINLNFEYNINDSNSL